MPFRGKCLVYRTEIMEFHGQWLDADREAQRAYAWLSRPPVEPAIGEAHYRRAELHRLRGDGAAAEEDYREASRWGRSPDPGLALLRLAQGDGAAAAASIHRALDEAIGMNRARLLEPFIEIMLETGDIEAATTAVGELAAVADRSGAPLLLALAARADGEVRLAAGDARAALPVLRQAEARWHELDAPYESARVRVQVGLACRAVGDADAAGLEFDGARRVFAELGARPDLGRLGRLVGGTAQPAPGGLTGRELEVLRLLGRPILLGTSRKSTLGRVLDLPPDQRVEATLATTALGIAGGADMIRVHDVEANARVARLSDAVVRATWRSDTIG